jgi:glycosyltransferase involved in cell wall biosynthesis
MLSKVSIVIPIFNEAGTVEQLLEAVLRQPLPANLAKELVLIESNSSDGSRQKVEAFVNRHQGGDATLKLILQDAPRGKGFAVREGLVQATGDIVLIQDADLEYDVADYPTLLQPILDGHADFVLGSRHLSAGHWKIRRFERNPLKASIMNFGGRFFHMLFNVVYGVSLTDPTTMYKVFLRECIRGVNFESNRFDFDWELVAKLVRLGFTPYEVPISYRSRGFDEGKKVNFFRDPFTYIRAIFKYRVQRISRTPRRVQESIVKMGSIAQ